MFVGLTVRAFEAPAPLKLSPTPTPLVERTETGFCAQHHADSKSERPIIEMVFINLYQLHPAGVGYHGTGLHPEGGIGGVEIGRSRCRRYVPVRVHDSGWWKHATDSS